MTRPAAAPVPFIDIRINGSRASVSGMVAEARGLMEGDTVTLHEAETLYDLNAAALSATIQLVSIWAENHARNR